MKISESRQSHVDSFSIEHEGNLKSKHNPVPMLASDFDLNDSQGQAAFATASNQVSIFQHSWPNCYFLTWTILTFSVVVNKAYTHARLELITDACISVTYITLFIKMLTFSNQSKQTASVVDGNQRRKKERKKERGLPRKLNIQ
ncbi:hypothetical protein T10_10899 [Trichinella papuae]|uniref:Uncharacterized protein n=1 Tax=Trichinella papuae TaxID=268474 RepID=A0A0V1MI64_9BILA|nr:hypothetical protein T10_10899 [Trichinella papuae]